MKVAVAYYSRTGNTEAVVRLLCDALRSCRAEVEAFRIKASREYSPPLHFNPRLVIDTLIRRGTDVSLEPENLDPSRYDVVVIASPIWIGTLSSPVQQFLKSYARGLKNYVVLTTSALRASRDTISKKKAEKIAQAKPLSCFNVTVSEIKDEARLKELIQKMASKIRELSRL